MDPTSRKAKSDTLASRLFNYSLNQVKYNLTPPIDSIGPLALNLIGHRGCGTNAFRNRRGGNYVENCFESFREGIHAGFAGIEFDIHLTKDDELIVFHDPSFRNCEGKKIAMADNTATELKAEFTKKYKNRMLTLAELVNEFQNAGAYFCELKTCARPQDFVDRVAEVFYGLPAELSQKLHFISFEFDLMKRLRLKLSSARIYFIATFFRYQDYHRSLDAGLTGVMGHHHLFSLDRLDYLAKLGLGSGFGITNNAQILNDIADPRVDFYFSDNKDLLRFVKTTRPN